MRRILSLIGLLALACMVQAVTIEAGVKLQAENTTYNLPGEYTCDTSITVNSSGLNLCSNYSLKITPTEQTLDVEIHYLSNSYMNFTETPSFLIDAEHNISGWSAGDNLTAYVAGSLDGNATVDETGFFSYTTNDNFNSETNIWFLTMGTTTTTVTTTSTTTTTEAGATTTTLYANRQTPCFQYLATVDFKEFYKCVYVGDSDEVMQRSDSSPAMGYWFYGMISIVFSFIFWFKTRRIESAAFSQLMFMALFRTHYPPQLALINWGIAVLAVANILYGLIKNE